MLGAPVRRPWTRSARLAGIDTFYASSGNDPIDIGAQDHERYGWPETAVIDTLNRLGRDGWRVTKDKGFTEDRTQATDQGQL